MLFQPLVWTAISTGKIVGVFEGVHKISDISMYRLFGLGELLAKNDEFGLGDKGYQGAERLLTPFKNPRGGKCTQEQKFYNYIHGTFRVNVERTIGRIQNFGCFDHWRGRCELAYHEPAFYVIAHMVNISLDLSPMLVSPPEVLYWE